MVQGLKQARGSTVTFDVAARRRLVARQVGAGVARAGDLALHQRVAGLPVGRDGRDAHGPVLVRQVVRFFQDRGTGALGLRDAPIDIGHLQRDVDDAVAVAGVMRHQGAVGADRALEDEPDRARTQDERLVVAVAVLRPRIRDQFHAPRGLEVARRLGGIADHENDGIPTSYREWVVARVILHQADQLLELVDVEPGLLLLVGQGALVRHRDILLSCAASRC